jgi:hypothetical protein
MENFIEVAAAAGKVIRQMIVCENSPSGRDVLLRFTDGTEMVIELRMEASVNVKLYRSSPGDMELLQEYKDPDGISAK